jgi:hypothetical protein
VPLLNLSERGMCPGQACARTTPCVVRNQLGMKNIGRVGRRPIRKLNTRWGLRNETSIRTKTLVEALGSTDQIGRRSVCRAWRDFRPARHVVGLAGGDVLIKGPGESLITVLRIAARFDCGLYRVVAETILESAGLKGNAGDVAVSCRLSLMSLRDVRLGGR